MSYSSDEESFSLEIEESEEEENWFNSDLNSIDKLKIGLEISKHIYCSSQSKKDKEETALETRQKILLLLHQIPFLNYDHEDIIKAAPIQLIPTLLPHFSCGWEMVVKHTFKKIFKYWKIGGGDIEEYVLQTLTMCPEEDVLKALLLIMGKDGIYKKLTYHNKLKALCRLKCIKTYFLKLISKTTIEEGSSILLVKAIEKIILVEYNPFGEEVYQFILDNLELFTNDFMKHFLLYLSKRGRVPTTNYKKYTNKLIELMGQCPSMENVFINFLVKETDYWEEYIKFALPYRSSHEVIKKILNKKLKLNRSSECSLYYYYLGQIALAELDLDTAILNLLLAKTVYDAPELRSRLIASTYFLEPLSEHQDHNLDISGESVIKLLHTVRELKIQLQNQNS